MRARRAPAVAATQNSAVINLLVSSDEEDQKEDKKGDDSAIDDDDSTNSDNSSYNDKDPNSATVRSAWISARKRPRRTPVIAAQNSGNQHGTKGKGGAPLYKQNLPPPGRPGSSPVIQSEYGRRVYTPLEGETPAIIADKFGLTPETVIRDNRGHFRRFRSTFLKEGETLENSSPLSSCSVVLLPLPTKTEGDIDGDIVDMPKNIIAKNASNLSREREEQLKRKRDYSKQLQKEVQMHGPRTPNDGVPRYIDDQTTYPFNEASHGDLIHEADRSDRRIYVCRANETPAEIARKNSIACPNPAGRVVYDNRRKHHGLGIATKMKEGDILILPPIPALARNGHSVAQNEDLLVSQGRGNGERLEPDRHESSLPIPQEIYIPPVHVKNETGTQESHY